MKRLTTAILVVTLAGNVFAFQKKAAPETAKAPAPVQQSEPVSSPKAAPAAVATPPAADTDSQPQPVKESKKKDKAKAPPANSEAKAREAKRQLDEQAKKAQDLQKREAEKIKKLPPVPAISQESRKLIQDLNATLDEALAK